MQTTSSLLIDEDPLMVLPGLAKAIGLNEAIVLQQVHYWLKRPSNKNLKNGRRWVYNTYQEWQEQFPFWSKATIQRTIYNLEKMGLLIVDEFNRMAGDRTKWYSVDYDKLEAVKNTMLAKCEDPSTQNDEMVSANCIDASTQNATSNTRDYTETNNKDYYALKSAGRAAGTARATATATLAQVNPNKLEEAERAWDSPGTTALTSNLFGEPIGEGDIAQPGAKRKSKRALTLESASTEVKLVAQRLTDLGGTQWPKGVDVDWLARKVKDYGVKAVIVALVVSYARFDSGHPNKAYLEGTLRRLTAEELNEYDMHGRKVGFTNGNKQRRPDMGGNGKVAGSPGPGKPRAIEYRNGEPVDPSDGFTASERELARAAIRAQRANAQVAS